MVNAQIASPDVNVVSGFHFEPEDDADKIADTKDYLVNLSISDKAALCKEMLRSLYADNPQQLEAFSSMGEAELAAMMDQYLANNALDDESLLMLYDAYISPGSYDDNMTAFGWVSLDAPSSISVYADSFEDKDLIAGCIEDYNATAASEDQIHYTDYVGLLMSSVTTIVDVISYVLIAFVSVSLIVSSIMIGIITYISVLERTKEIGILRAIGASKRNVAQVFNAETFIIGLCSGLLGVGITALLLIPINSIIHSLAGITTINAALPIVAAGFLIDHNGKALPVLFVLALEAAFPARLAVCLLGRLWRIVCTGNIGGFVFDLRVGFDLQAALIGRFVKRRRNCRGNNRRIFGFAWHRNRKHQRGEQDQRRQKNNRRQVAPCPSFHILILHSHFHHRARTAARHRRSSVLCLTGAPCTPDRS